ncbi:MAG: NAD(P)H-hydrate dehydratase [Oceanicaulis sp.]
MTDHQHAVLSVASMAKADAYAMKTGVSGMTLMEAAGEALARAIVRRWSARKTAVLCGPGNNGGDGWVAARRLAEAGWPVTVFAMKPVGALEGDARIAAERWRGETGRLEDCDPSAFGLVIDALFGAGLSRPLEGEPARLARACANLPVVSADVPSGVHGDRARADGPAFEAELTVTFHRFKPAHLLHPGRAACGEIVLADIGVPDGWDADAKPVAEHNDPDLWRVPGLSIEAAAHKHTRGRLCVLSGAKGASGAARLAAEAGLSGGAGYVTLLCPPDALAEAAASMQAVVTRAFDPDLDFAKILKSHRADCAILGPGAGKDEGIRAKVLSACASEAALVLDADALTVFEDDPDTLFKAAHARCVLTPHAGEFSKLFGGLLDESRNKIEAAREAARRSGAVVVLKGPDTVVAAPDGRVRINTHASPRLATAGTGDSLAGLIGAFLAQGADAFDAASAAVWVHGEAGRRMGPGAHAGTLLSLLPGALAHLRDRTERKAALRRLSPRGV